MDELKLSQILGNALGTGTAVAAVLLILWRVLSRVADRYLVALDNVSKGLADHTRTDLAHHAEVRESIIANHAGLREAVVRVETKLDSALDWRERTTPVEAFAAAEDLDARRRKQTVPHGYRVPRPGTHHDE
jgi:hypothetical protein